MGAGQLQAGVGRLKAAAEEVPLFGSKLLEGIEPVELGMSQLGQGLGRAQDGQSRLTQATLRLDEELATLVDGSIAAGTTIGALSARWPEDARISTLMEGARELARASDQLAGGLRQVGTGATALQGGLGMLGDGAGRLQAGLELVRSSLPAAVDSPGGSAQGLALSVEPVIEIVAPVPNSGISLTPNFVPMALWVGAVMTAFLVHFRRVPEALVPLPRTALAAGKLALPLAAVVLQALLMLAMLAGVLHVPMPRPMLFAALLVVASCTFLALVWALVRALGDLGKVVAVLLLIVQVSAAGALLPIELSDEAFQAMQPYLPLTWVVHAFRAVLFDAYDGQFAPAFAVVAVIGVAALILGTLVGRWRGVPADQWRPPLDIE
jgi:putative membrane protein